MNSIVIDERISSGSPTIRGRRLTVYNVVSKIYYEDSLESVMKDYEISLIEVKEAVSYCSELLCQRDSRLHKFCSGCILRTLQESWNFEKSDYDQINLDRK
jgi:uncharacterized protein (DUF433 family)